MRSAAMRNKNNTNAARRKSCPKAGIVVLNWNGWRDTIECLNSLGRIIYSNYQIVLVDNGSTDGSPERIREHIERNEQTDAALSTGASALSAAGSARQHVRCIRCFAYNQGQDKSPLFLLELDINLGYAGGNNVGIAWALDQGCDYVLVLNNDTIVEPEMLSHMVDVAKESHASVVGALVKDASNGRILFSNAQFPASLFYAEPQRGRSESKWWESFRVDGSAMLLQRHFLQSRLRSVGYFLDESLFLYCEEIELGLWCRKMRLKSVLAGAAIVYHKVSASTGGKGKPLQFYYMTRNRVHLARRYLPRLGKIAFFCSYPVWRLFRAGLYFGTGKVMVARAILEGLWHGILGRDGQRPASPE